MSGIWKIVTAAEVVTVALEVIMSFCQASEAGSYECCSDIGTGLLCFLDSYSHPKFQAPSIEGLVKKQEIKQQDKKTFYLYFLYQT